VAEDETTAAAPGQIRGFRNWGSMKKLKKELAQTPVQA
jgi:hypothetical protein